MDLTGFGASTDLAGASTDGAVPPGTLQCTTYTSAASVKALRDPAAAMHVAGCFELANVVVIGRTSSQTKPRLFVQDAAGGDYSALMAKCSQTGVHTCMSLPTMLQINSGQVVTVQGHYAINATSGFEELAIEHVSITGSGSVPAPAVVTLADIATTAQRPKIWFQKVSSTVPAGNPLIMYDFSPAELKTASGSCPFYNGFSMIPSASAPGGFTPVGCSGTTNPAPQPNQSAEIVINRFFYSDFNWHCDCACQTPVKILLKSTATVAAGSAISGVLAYEVNIANPNAGHQELMPLHMTEFPITN